MKKTWFITGASRGFGRQFTKAALERGDNVAATTRNTEALSDLAATYGDALLPLALDITDKAAVTEAVKHAHDHFGRLDVVVNNAGYGLFGAVEEIEEQQLRDQFDVNVFGAFWVTQAALPFMREQGSGHIIQISSIGGVMAFPTLGGYHGSKWALEGFTDSLAQEVAGFGIKVTLVEPAGYDTDWSGGSSVRAARHPAYAPLHQTMDNLQTSAVVGDASAAAKALLTVVDADNPPLRVLFGAMSQPFVRQAYQQRLDTWTEWAELSTAAEGTR